MATRILGMGILYRFAERAQEVFDEKEALKMQEKCKKLNFRITIF